MTDSYMVIGTVLAVLASAVLFLRQPKAEDKKMKSDILKIGEQMKMYKQTAAAAAAAENANKRRESIEAGAYPGGRITILFGSQTGTAEGFAEALKKEGRKQGFEAHTMDLEEYNAQEELPKEKCVIFVMATYGEGDPTDNAVAFVKLLKGKTGKLGAEEFKGVGYTVFGLGNRQYEHFNLIGRLVDEKMEQYGAHRVYNYGEGDDDGTMDEDFDAWKERLWKELRKQFVPGAADEDDSAVATGSSADALELEYNCVEIRAPVGGVAPSSNVRMKTSTKHFFTAASAKVVVNREIRPSTEKGSTIHVEFDLKDTGVEYLTADNLAILPENLPENVERLVKRLGYDLEQWIKLEPVGDDTNGELPFPTPCTIETILTSYLGINSAPRKSPLKQLAYFARDEAEKQKLLFLASMEGKDEYQRWILDDERSFVDVLEHFKSIKMPLAALIQLVPYLTPRYYTISSSSLVNPQRVHATVSIITNKKADGRVFNGVCTTYLAGLEPLSNHTDKKKKRDSRPGEQGSKQPREWPSARIFVRPSTFRLPKDPKTPIILIGPGTGIAPMRAFLHERAHMQKNGVEVGKSILYFGCRRQDDDYIYRDELEGFQASGVLTELHLAFSREQSKKVYVQHLLEQQGEKVWELIGQEGAYVFVCGATTMGNDVQKVLHEVVQKHGNQSSEQAQATLKKLQDSHRYVQELWA
ncbi:hypothetical protein Poli38472_003051 [Pythium oligandrum]|uniref:NADPH--cytochrome P450 reductase n=1 Tax=Pythium oligandrum TaxID=41045 RepID=A0A8K1C5U4_PYTOL|nr:hypothetical protein Poli38472_003051 [Pythium oligandrum]|eukprot:TMW57126.1 hypothetical protein Poli38472_003051 [Pythium oligandrum]